MRKFRKISSSLLLILSALCIIAQYYEGFWLFQIINIGLPVLLLLNVLALIWGKLFGKIHYTAIISFILLIFGSWNNWNIPNAEKESTEPFRIASYNIRLFDFYNWLGRETWDEWSPRTDNGRALDSITDFVGSLDLEVICFQEYFNQTKGWLNSYERLTDKLGFTYAFTGINFKENQNEYGLATFSKHPIIYSETVFFSPQKSNGILVTDLLLRGDTVRVINAHLESFRFQKEDYRYFKALQEDNFSAIKWESSKNIISRLIEGADKRKVQINQLLLLISKSNYPTILCADLNELPHSRMYYKLNQKLVDSFKNSNQVFGSTHEGPFPGFRIDYIFHSPEIKTINQKAINTPVLSDHFPVIAELKW